jgi:hypothetical protein
MFQKEKEVMLRIGLIIIVIGTASLSAHGQKNHRPTVPTVTVCEALLHAPHYDGKIVRIKGQVVATDEGAGFVGDCPGVFVTDGKMWPSAIAWTNPSESFFVLHPVTFTFDMASRQRLQKKWEQLRKRLPDRCIAVTYTGMFESWSKDKASKTDPKGHVYQIPGFGHLNAAPAQLVLKSADDVTAIPTCN